LRILGFEISRKREIEQENKSFVSPENEDGSVVVNAGGSFGTYVDLDGVVRTDAELVTKYRDMSMNSDISMAIDEIVNEAICIGEDDDIVKIRMDTIDDLPVKVRKVIEDEFKNVLKMLLFDKNGHDLFKRWYVDGRMYFHVVIDDKDPASGIQQLRFIDPRKIKKVREVTNKKIEGAEKLGMMSAMTQQVVNEYYIYNEKGFGGKGVGSNKAPNSPAEGIKIAKDSIIYVTSGVLDSAGQTVLSYLHQAIKPLNQLKALEDSTVIYRLVRAPERRVWKISVGNLPNTKAEQYLNDIMVKYKNRLTYDITSGEVRDDRKYLSMLEDIWLPVRGDGKGTELDTLPAGELTGVLDDVLYFQKKLYNALYVPVSRINPENAFTSGLATEVTREEVKFAKFIFKIRQRFCDLFLQILEKQVILKNIMDYDTWNDLSSQIKFDFVKDNYFAESKELLIMQDRLNTAQLADQWEGKYFSKDWIRRQILRQTEEDIEQMDQDIDIETQEQGFNSADMNAAAQMQMPLPQAPQPPMGFGDPTAMQPQDPNAMGMPPGMDQGQPPMPGQDNQRDVVDNKSALKVPPKSSKK
jgi:hypothetical protein